MGEANTVSGAKIKPFYERKSRIKLSSLFDLKLTEMEGVDEGRTGARCQRGRPHSGGLIGGVSGRRRGNGRKGAGKTGRGREGRGRWDDGQ